MNKIPPNDPDEAAKAKPIDPYQARRERWIRPLNGSYDRLRAWVNMIFMDHAFFRMAYLNLHSVSPKVWRAAQPLPYQIHRMARRGVKTVLTLRGGQSFGSYPLEVEACDRARIKFEKLEFRSRALPSVAELEAAEALFANLEYPVMMHCKS
ncbi:MAG: protein tyrosine phosphatase, partial [Pseudomonadota bacterium]